ncbi:MAG: hypothetical protein M0023_04380 [Desulfobacteraceae bacterium]|nr:hypothetical protein [Desulfobacteraceae bacterium]
MKSLKSLFCFTLIVLVCAVTAFAADPVATVAVAPIATVSILDWFKQNSAAIFGALFAISEVLGAIPGFKGNGIFDTIVKALSILSNKQEAL